MNDNTSRVDAEWIALNAFRGLTKIASKGDLTKSTYDNALDLGGVLYPDLLGPENSVLRRDRESDTAKEYRQKAQLLTIRNRERVDPAELLRLDIDEYKGLLSIAGQNKGDKTRVDQLKKKLGQLINAEREMTPVGHSENQLIFRDAYNVHRELPSLASGQGYRDFKLPDDNVLRVRVLHPDRPEHISGADVIYERHNPNAAGASIVAVQYKIWTDKMLYLTDPRMVEQIGRLQAFTCDKKVCQNSLGASEYRFPCCAAFLRPTDKLQKTDQKYFSTGEHLPICKIDECKTVTARGAEILEYSRIRDVSLNSEMFEYLFNKGKIGSRMLSYEELETLYSEFLVSSSEDNVVIYAQEFAE